MWGFFCAITVLSLLILALPGRYDLHQWDQISSWESESSGTTLPFPGFPVSEVAPLMSRSGT